MDKTQNLTKSLFQNRQIPKIFTPKISGYPPFPDEYLNRDLKSNLNNKPLGRAKGKIEEHAKSYMDAVSQKPAHIAKLFHAESVLYAS